MLISETFRMAANHRPPVTHESELASIESRVMLPNGEIKEHYKLDKNSTIREEKERLLKAASIPYPVLYAMVLLGPQQSRTVLNDSLTICGCIPSLAQGDKLELEIGKRSSELERPPRPINPDDFSIKMKR